MNVWTVIMGFLFLAVYKDLAMPQFSGTMLALMGISAELTSVSRFYD